MSKESKDKLRNDILELLPRPDNKRGKYTTPTEILNKVGVDKGNFSSFLSGATTVSDMKLSLILNELKLGNNPTNRDRLALLPTEECIKELSESYFDNPLRQYIDFNSWLDSKEQKIIYIGEEGKYLDEAMISLIGDCIIVGEDPEDNKKNLIIVKSNITNKDVLISVDKNRAIPVKDMDELTKKMIGDK